MTQSQDVRDYCIEVGITPARISGLPEVTMNAGDVATALGLEDRVPNVCQSMGGRKLEEQANVRTIPSNRPPSRQSPTMNYRYIILSNKKIEKTQN